jgi:predicted NBD/HSP70 family sugar kinase
MRILKSKRLHVGLDCGGTKFGGIVLDADWRRLVYHEVPARSEWSPRETRAMIESFLADLFARANADPSLAGTLGIGIPGVIDDRGNVLKVVNLPALERTRFDGLLPRATMTVWNDAACAAYGESIAGSLVHAVQGVHLTLGTGVGGATVVKTGSRNLLGADQIIEVANIEIGHIVANIRAASNTGRDEPFELEEFCSRKFFKRSTEKTIPELFDAWKARDERAKKLFDQFGANVGALLATVETLFKPDTISLSGGCLHAFPAYRDTMLRVFRKLRFLPGIPARIERSQLGPEVGAFGAALYGAAGDRNLSVFAARTLDRALRGV